MEARTPPAVRLDKVAGLDFDPDLVSESVGELHIRSVYDIDGTASASIDTLRDPALTTAAQRPARFLRVIKAVSLPDRRRARHRQRGIRRQQFHARDHRLRAGRTRWLGQDEGAREHRVRRGEYWTQTVVAFRNAHLNWMTLKAGEVIECNGCHTRQSELPHGRPDAEAPSANPGAPSDGSPFPNTEPALFANAGETMAETYTRINGVPKPNVDIKFDDVWTDANVRAKDASFAYAYAALTTTPPVDPGCVTNWTASCRIIVNYEMSIHPLWSVPRLAADGVTNATCNSCHSPADAMGAAQVPAAQLDLVGWRVGRRSGAVQQLSRIAVFGQPTGSDERRIGRQPDSGYRCERKSSVPDGRKRQPDSGCQWSTDSGARDVATSPPLSPAGALASPRFFSRFNAGGSHAGWLTPAELKLISEWLDIGAQYFNDPFAAPPA